MQIRTKSILANAMIDKWNWKHYRYICIWCTADLYLQFNEFMNLLYGHVNCAHKYELLAEKKIIFPEE